MESVAVGLGGGQKRRGCRRFMSDGNQDQSARRNSRHPSEQISGSQARGIAQTEARTRLNCGGGERGT